MRKYLFLLLILVLPLGSCGTKHKAHKAQRATEKRMELRRKEGEKALVQGKKNHYKLQSPETRKRMKETQKRNKQLHNPRKKPFFIRWFSPN